MSCSWFAHRDCSASRRWAAISTPGATDGDAESDTSAESESGTETRAETDTEAETETRSEEPAQEKASWPVRYLREHLVHIGVLVAFALYPGIYAVLVTSPIGAEMVTILPEVETMIAVFYFGLFAMSFDFISGYTGYLSFGHAAFYGIGAYFLVLVANGKVPVLESAPFMVLVVLAGVLAALCALVLGAISFRLSGVYFAMITLGFAQVLYIFMSNWRYIGSNPEQGAAVLGRTDGFEIGVPYVDSANVAIGALTGDEVSGLLGFIDLSTAEVSYYAIGLVVVVCYLAMQRIIHSPFGRVMIAIRENEQRAEAIGYSTLKYKLGAFAISAFFAAVAGGLFVGYRRSVAPDNSLFFLVTGDALVASIIGGFGTLAGPLFGRLFDEGLREFLSAAGEGGGLLPYLRGHLPAEVLATDLVNGLTVREAIETFLNGHASLYLGVLFVLFVLFVPNGLLGTLRARLGGPVAKRLPERVRRYARALRR